MRPKNVVAIGVLASLVVAALLYWVLVAPLQTVRGDLHRMAAELSVATAPSGTAQPLTPKEATELRTSLYSADISAVGAILSFVSLVAVIVSILFVVGQTQALAVQTRQISESIRQASTAALTERNFSLHEVFIEKPHLRPYFYDGVPITSRSHEHYLQALAVAGYLLDSFYYLIHETQKAQSAVGEEVSAAWFEPYIRNSFEQSDVLCSYFDAYEEWFAMDTAGQALRRLRGSHHHPPQTRVARTNSVVERAG